MRVRATAAAAWLKGDKNEMSEDTSDADDDFVLESLPDTEELDDEDDGDGLDSEEQPYEAETGFLDAPCSATEGGSSVVGGTQAEAFEHANEQLRRSKRRKLGTGAAASDAGPVDEQATSQARPQGRSWQQPQPQQQPSSSVEAAASSVQQQKGRGGLRPAKPRTPLKQRKQQHGMQLRHHAAAADATAAAAAGLVAPTASHNAQYLQEPAGQHSRSDVQVALKHPQESRQHQPSVHSPSRTAQQHSLLQSQPSNPLGTTFTASEAAATAATDDAASMQADSQAAICYRTRSKHPLAAEEFDPDMFDRLLAEFDPDVEPLMDDAMYQQFLQSLQGDGPAGSLVPAGLDPGWPGTAAAAAAVAAAAGPGAGMAAAGGPAPAGAANPAGGIHGEENEESDEEFQLDPLDWLLDDERDAAEEEVLAQLVHIQAHQNGAGRQQQQQQQQQHHATAAAARRRSQREAARRAAERIAFTQQQQKQKVHLLPGTAAAAAGGGATGQLQFLDSADVAGMGSAAQVLMPQQLAVLGASATIEQQQQQLAPVAAADTTAAAAAAAGQLGNPYLAIGSNMQLLGPPGAVTTAAAARSEADDDAAAAAAAADGDGRQVPEILTLKDTQLQQLYHQFTLHTQLLTQLYVLTARDPAPSSQAIASSAGQMLEQLRRLHATAAGSYRGQQLAQLLQQAFHTNRDRLAAAQEETQQQWQWTPAKQQWTPTAQQRQRQSTEDLLPGVQHGGSSTAGAFRGGVWQPAFTDIRAVYDTQALRQLDDVVNALQQVPMPDRPIWETWDPEYAAASSEAEAGSASQRRWAHASSIKAAAQQQQQRALKDLRQVIEASLVPYRTGCIVAAWPLLAPRMRSVVWNIHEDDLMWLGIVRFHNAITPLQDTAELIAQELLPTKSSAVILNRYKNQIKNKSPTAVLLLSYALLGKERPAAWGCSDGSQDADEDEQQQQGGPWSCSGGRGLGHEGLDGLGCWRYKATGGRRVPRGPMWAAAELGAALTVAFATVQTGMPSAAAAAAAGVLLQDSATAAAAAAAAREVGTQDAGAPAAVCAGQQLLVDLVAAAAARLPFGLPAPPDIPSAGSMRRRRPRYSASRPAGAAAAGEHLLLSLAARQLLQGPEGLTDDEDGDEGDEDSHGGAAAAAAAAAGVSRREGQLGGLLGSVFGGRAAAAVAGTDHNDVQPPAAAGLASPSLLAATAAAGTGGNTAGGGVRGQATPVKSYVALLQASPLPDRQQAATQPAAAAAGVADACLAGCNGSKCAGGVKVPQNQTGVGAGEARRQQEAGTRMQGAAAAAAVDREGRQQQQQEKCYTAEDDMDFGEPLDEFSIEQQQRQEQQAKQQEQQRQQHDVTLPIQQQEQQQGAGQLDHQALSDCMLDGLQPPPQQQQQQDAQQLHQLSQQLKTLQDPSAQGKQQSVRQQSLSKQQQRLQELPGKQLQQGRSNTTALCILGRSPTSEARAKQRQQQQQQQQAKILSPREIAKQLQQLQHAQQQRQSSSNALAHAGLLPGTSTGVPQSVASAQQQQDSRQVQRKAVAGAGAAEPRGKQQQQVGDAAASAAAHGNVPAGVHQPGADGAAAAGAVKKVRKSLFGKETQPGSCGNVARTATAASAAAQAGKPAGDQVCFGIGLGAASWYQPDCGQQLQQQNKLLRPPAAAAAAAPPLLPRYDSNAGRRRQQQRQVAPQALNAAGFRLSLGFNNTAVLPPQQQQQQGSKKPKKKHFSRGKFVPTQAVPSPSQTLSAVAARRYAELTALQGQPVATKLLGLLGTTLHANVANADVGSAAGHAHGTAAGAAGTSRRVMMPGAAAQAGANVQYKAAGQVRATDGAMVAAVPTTAVAGEFATARLGAAGAATAAAAAASGLPSRSGSVTGAAVAAVKGRRVKQPARGTPHRKLAAVAAAVPGEQPACGVGVAATNALQQLAHRVQHVQQPHAQQQPKSADSAGHFSGLAALAEAAAVAAGKGRP